MTHCLLIVDYLDSHRFVLGSNTKRAKSRKTASVHRNAGTLMFPCLGIDRPSAMLEFMADGRFIAFSYSGDITLIMLSFLEDVNLVSFVVGSMCGYYFK
jgi:hypothetical protein